MQPDSVSQILATAFGELGVVDPQPGDRTAIFHDRYFVGYLFRCGDLRAVWFVDTGVIKFYDADRKPLRTMKLWGQARRAA